jgi:hypothetical protein
VKNVPVRTSHWQANNTVNDIPFHQQSYKRTRDPAAPKVSDQQAVSGVSAVSGIFEQPVDSDVDPERARISARPLARRLSYLDN